jgi:hypothetical protein
MKLNEISNQDKFFLTLKGIDYDFSYEYSLIIDALPIMGKSMNRKSILPNNIDYTIQRIELFLSQGFDGNDIDILSAKNILDKLHKIKNQLWEVI